MATKFSPRRNRTWTSCYDALEPRRCLSGDGILAPADACLAEVSIEGPAARAARAVNCFAIDLYQHLQHEDGNLLLSPLSISTALTMFYAGADGETAAQMEDVLHLGTEPGIHESFAALLESLQGAVNSNGSYTLDIANAMWPRTGVTLHDTFVDTVRTDYGGEARNLDYSDSAQAAATINDWVSDKTRGRIEDLVTELSPQTVMSVTNSIYFQSIWESYFDAAATRSERFWLDDGTMVRTPIMYVLSDFAVGRLPGNRVIEVPFANDLASMVIVLPSDRMDTELTAEEITEVSDWLNGPREVQGIHLRLPKFTTTVATQFEELLPEMGMPLAFSNADFSKMTPHHLNIDLVHHKAFFEVNEDGAEAAAATIVSGGDCFAAGTPVLTPDGAVPIERIRPGDLVLARDEFNLTGRIEPKRVQDAYRRDGKTMNLHLNGGAVRVTRRHPFFVRGRGWTLARDLQVGDELATDLHSWTAVIHIDQNMDIEPVFNLHVADHHTYFIGGASWGRAIWVHNCSGGQCFYADRPFHFLVRDNTTSTFLLMGRMSDPTMSENNLAPVVDRIVGDSNGDGVFDSRDLVKVFASGKYEDDSPGNATFEEGDWNNDGDFNSADLVFAFETGEYEPVRQAINRSAIAAAVSEQVDREEDDDTGRHLGRPVKLAADPIIDD